MVIYAISDIHGEYDKYIEMPKLIEFNDADTMYVIGDVVDRGPKPVKVLKDMMCRTNVFPIIGNHEFMAIDILDELLVKVTSENFESHITTKTLSKTIEWQQNGGDITLEQIKLLPNEERESVLDYLKGFTTLEVVNVGKRIYVLAHAGFTSIDPAKDINDYSAEDVAFIRPDYDRKVFKGKNTFVVSGHTSTFYITGKSEIYHSSNNICIDCGATFWRKISVYLTRGYEGILCISR